MIYTVGEMAKMLDVPASTLRYYDKEGLLPFVERSPGGIRMFQESDYSWLKIISCLKKAGMSLKDIREYINLALQGDETIEQRLELFYKQREILHYCNEPYDKMFLLKKSLPNTAKPANGFTMRTEYIL